MGTRYGTTIYRQGGGNLLAGIGALILFGGLTWRPLSHLMSGKPMLLTEGRSPETRISYLATPGDLRVLVFGFGLFVAMAVILILGWINAYVVADEWGVRGRNFLGRTTFRAPWSEIDRVERKSRRRAGDIVVLHAGSRRLRLLDYPEADELVHRIRERSPHASIEPWR